MSESSGGWPPSPLPDEGLPPYSYQPVVQPRRERWWLHLGLLLLTIASTTVVGGCHYISYTTDFVSINDLPDSGRQLLSDLLSNPSFYLHGLWYSLTVLAILGCHEMGHYIACLRYGVDVSPPYFLPAPLPLTGTLGAFIRIRSRIPTKVALFDIGIAGPFAGFVVAVPALFIGLSLSRMVKLPADPSDLMELGEPLLFRFASWLVWGAVPDGYSINMHPMAFAAWFGLLATALNLFPIGQLDGGHVSYAVLGRRSTIVTLVMVVVAVGLSFRSSSWIAWTVLLIVMLFTLGPRHPRTLDEEIPLDRGRLVLAAIAMAMLVVCFTPAPIEPFVTGGPPKKEELRSASSEHRERIDVHDRAAGKVGTAR